MRSVFFFVFFFSSRRRHTRYWRDWSSDVCSSDLPVREFFLANAAYWIDEFHFDGLRLDATQQIFDTSSEHIIAAISQIGRASCRERGVDLGGRRVIKKKNNKKRTRM